MSPDFYSPVWRDFARAHADPEICRCVEKLFANHWPAELPRPGREGARFGVIGRENFDQVEVLTDARLEIISPVHDRAGSHRGAHLDTRTVCFRRCFTYAARTMIHRAEGSTYTDIATGRRRSIMRLNFRRSRWNASPRSPIGRTR